MNKSITFQCNICNIRYNNYIKNINICDICYLLCINNEYIPKLNIISNDDANLMPDDDKNRCVECFVDMGDHNPRQLCSKVFCENML
jgi:hypothetical protein